MANNEYNFRVYSRSRSLSPIILTNRHESSSQNRLKVPDFSTKNYK